MASTIRLKTGKIKEKMSFYKLFTSSYKKKGFVREKATAAHKHTWPQGSQYEKKVALEMREIGKGQDWYHVVDVGEKEALREKALWEENNPGWEFRLPAGAQRPKKPGPEFFRPREARRKWDSETAREREARLGA